MSNKQLIRSAYIYFLAVLVACGLWAIAGKAENTVTNQNSNQNSNANQQPATQNRNANKSANRNTGATGEQTGMGNLTAKDRDFMMDAAMGGLEEVALGHIAAQKGTSDAVKQFGERMVTDHTQANTELTTLASSKGVTLPTTLDEKHQKDITKLSAMSGAEFDRAYSKMMLSDHNKDVSEFEKQSTKATDPDLKAFASKTLPTLQEHLQLAKALPDNAKSNTGGSKNSNSNRNSNRP